MIDEASLARIGLFEGLNAAAVRLLRECAVERRHSPGTVLWRQGEQPLGLFVVLDGEVRVFRDGDGRRRVVHSETAGGTLGEIPLFEGTRYPATAIASRRTTTLAFDRDTILAAIRADPAFALALLRRLSGRVRHLIDRLERLTARSVTARLAIWIDARASSDGPFTLGTTQQELAEELGTVREVVVRELRALREAGILNNAGRGRYRLADRAALRRLAGGG